MEDIDSSSLIQDIEEIGNGFSGIVFKSNYYPSIMTMEKKKNEINDANDREKSISSFDNLQNHHYDRHQKDSVIPIIIAHKSYQNLADSKSIEREINTLGRFRNCPWIVNMLGSKLIYHENILIEASLYMEWMEYGSLKDIESLFCLSNQTINSATATTAEDDDDDDDASKSENDKESSKHSIQSQNNSKWKWPEAALGLVASNVLKALGFMNRVHGIVHQDIKPSNILLNKKGHVKLCDFTESSTMESATVLLRRRRRERKEEGKWGKPRKNSKREKERKLNESTLNKSLLKEEDRDLFSNAVITDYINSSLVGTLAYMAPEKLIKRDSHNRHQDHDCTKSDVWSLGMSLLELALNRYPFKTVLEKDKDDSSILGNSNYNDNTFSHAINAINANDNEATSSSLASFISSISLNNDSDGPLSLITPPSSSSSSAFLKTPPIQKIQITSKDGCNDGMTGHEDDPMAFIEMSESILYDPIPILDDKNWSDMFRDFLSKCLARDSRDRATPEELLLHDWIIWSENTKFDLVQWLEEETSKQGIK